MGDKLYGHVDVGYPVPKEQPDTEQPEKEKVGDQKSEAITDLFRSFIGSAPPLADK
ncbi:hypothetical protein [Desmospora activa]|uniref:Uncharacterized protein n=1 Tax=Desmospora activa DSM 45169 TaxID=1121389 RepID=A0A2T4Z903_9BACL|nr:hypothetical protein [Desmospora activa]PTM58347.1 hypothetical protein C8J48_0929 [Desmospora activa DSM 45169]